MHHYKQSSFDRHPCSCTIDWRVLQVTHRKGYKRVSLAPGMKVHDDRTLVNMDACVGSVSEPAIHYQTSDTTRSPRAPPIATKPEFALDQQQSDNHAVLCPTKEGIVYANRGY